jgi:hypothetical protein
LILGGFLFDHLIAKGVINYRDLRVDEGAEQEQNINRYAFIHDAVFQERKDLTQRILRIH